MPILHSLRKLGIADPKPREPKYGNIHDIAVAEIYYEPYWELEDALRALFGQVDGKLPAINQIVDVFKGNVLVDIAFYQYGTYPSLVFDKENMKKIRFLEADISIDPYGPFYDDEDDKKERTEEN